MTDLNKIVDQLKQHSSGSRLTVDVKGGPPASDAQVDAELGLLKLDETKAKMERLHREADRNGK